LKEFNFDYNQLAKKLLEQMPRGLKAIALQNFVDEYLAYVERNRAVKTLEGVRLVCKYLLSYFSPLRSIETIKLKDTECFLDSLKKSAPKGVYNYQRTLRAMWNKAIQWNYLRENPFEKIKLKKRQRITPAFVTEDQLEEIINSTENELVRDVIITAFCTGCRLGELINLTWHDVNLKDNLITIGNTSYQE
jgi:integrase